MALPWKLRIYSGENRLPVPCRILLTTYMSNALRGRNLGSAGYSYDFVAKLFEPLLARFGDVVPVAEPEKNLEALARQARQDGCTPIHVCFRALHDAVLCPGALNVAVPAWEFPDLPNCEIGGEPRHNWVWMSNLCDQVIVGGPFTKETFENGGVTTPISVVPVPIPEAYFQIDPWQPDEEWALNCAGYCFAPGSEPADTTSPPDSRAAYYPPPARHSLESLLKAWYKVYKRQWAWRMPGVANIFLAALARTARVTLNQIRHKAAPTRPLSLRGVVYTSIFNPGDGRKNWEDTITGFLQALGDKEDASLVLKLITSDRLEVHRVFAFYRCLGIPHRSKVIIIQDFLSEETLLQLVRASTYYVNTAKAEGNCLPLMNYLAANRPAIAPTHTAMGDYFTDRIGFPLIMHPEPATWPQEPSSRWRTTWQRLVWPSLVEQFRESYRLVKEEPARYQAMSSQARLEMLRWASYEAVEARLHEAFDSLLDHTRRTNRSAA